MSELKMYMHEYTTISLFTLHRHVRSTTFIQPLARRRNCVSWWNVLSFKKNLKKTSWVEFLYPDQCFHLKALLKKYRLRLPRGTTFNILTNKQHMKQHNVT